MPSSLKLPPYTAATVAELLAERLVDADEDVHFTESLAALVIETLTSPGDTTSTIRRGAENGFWADLFPDSDRTKDGT